LPPPFNLLFKRGCVEEEEEEADEKGDIHTTLLYTVRTHTHSLTMDCTKTREKKSLLNKRKILNRKIRRQKNFLVPLSLLVHDPQSSVVN